MGVLISHGMIHVFYFGYVTNAISTPEMYWKRTKKLEVIEARIKCLWLAGNKYGIEGK